MNTAQALAKAKKLKACEEGIEWLELLRLEPATDPWQKCTRGDWMLWSATMLGVDRRLVVKAACKCVERSLIYVPEKETRPKAAMKIALAWVEGAADIQQTKAAACMARAAARAALKDRQEDTFHAIYAVYAVVYATYITYTSYAAKAVSNALISSANAVISAGDVSPIFGSPDLVKYADITRSVIPSIDAWI